MEASGDDLPQSDDLAWESMDIVFDIYRGGRGIEILHVSELTCPLASIGNSVDTMLAASVENSDLLIAGASKSTGAMKNSDM